MQLLKKLLLLESMQLLYQILELLVQFFIGDAEVIHLLPRRAPCSGGDARGVSHPRSRGLSKPSPVRSGSGEARHVCKYHV